MDEILRKTLIKWLMDFYPEDVAEKEIDKAKIYTEQYVMIQYENGVKDYLIIKEDGRVEHRGNSHVKKRESQTEEMQDYS